ncbi:Uncharacterised protein [Chlamydia trachomatis]|nr:Uncharacterised protein [Chlamydia trachomatis]
MNGITSPPTLIRGLNQLNFVPSDPHGSKIILTLIPFFALSMSKFKNLFPNWSFIKE